MRTLNYANSFFSVCALSNLSGYLNAVCSMSFEFNVEVSSNWTKLSWAFTTLYVINSAIVTVERIWMATDIPFISKINTWKEITSLKWFGKNRAKYTYILYLIHKSKNEIEKYQTNTQNKRWNDKQYKRKRKTKETRQMIIAF